MSNPDDSELEEIRRLSSTSRHGGLLTDNDVPRAKVRWLLTLYDTTKARADQLQTDKDAFLLDLANERETVRVLKLVEESLHAALDASQGQLHATVAALAATTEACAKIAEAHKGSAAKRRREKFPKQRIDPELMLEIQAEERGEDIAAEIIARNIRSANAAAAAELMALLKAEHDATQRYLHTFEQALLTDKPDANREHKDAREVWLASVTAVADHLLTGKRDGQS